MKRWDVLIVGGGASGLSAAVEAAEAGASVCVAEKLPRVGKKLLATGNGRCNFTHSPLAQEVFHGDRALAWQVLGRMPDAEGFFRRLGVLSRIDSEGRVYPKSNQAAAIVDALRFRCEALGVAFLCEQTVTALKPVRGGFSVQLSGGTAEARRVILACGGAAAPSMGSNGDGKHLLAPFGVAQAPFRPALCPIPSGEAKLRALKGMRVQAVVTAIVHGKAVRSACGEVQFQEQALSGICVFDLAELAPQELSLDLLPEEEPSAVFALLQGLRQARRGCHASDWLTGLFPKRVGEAVLKEAKIAPHTPVEMLGKAQISAAAAVCKDFRFAVKAPANFATAQVSAGGVLAKEVDEHLELHKLPGCFVCGEALNVHANCGGYNLSFAWASGRLAGQSAAKHL